MYVHATKSNTFGHLFTGGPHIIQIGAAQIHKIYILNLARYLFLKIHTEIVIKFKNRNPLKLSRKF